MNELVKSTLISSEESLFSIRNINDLEVTIQLCLSGKFLLNNRFINPIIVNQELNRYCDLKDAWGDSMNIIMNSKSVETQYFASNIIYMKTKRHWSQCSEEERIQIIQVLLNHLISNIHTLYHLTYERLVLAICSFSLRIENGIQMLITSAIEQINRNQQNENIVIVWLKILIQCSKEYESQDMSRSLKVDIKNVFISNLSNTLQVIRNIMLFSEVIMNSCLDLLSTWMSYGLNIIELFNSYNDLFMNIFHASRNRRCSIKAYSFIEAIVCQPSTDSSRYHILTMILNFFLEDNLVGILLLESTDINSNNNETIICEVVSSICTIFIHEAEYILCHYEKNNQFIENLLLQYLKISIPTRRISNMCYDAFIRFQDFPVSSYKDPMLQSKVFSNVLFIIMQLSIYPLIEDDILIDDINEYRSCEDDNLELLRICYHCIRPKNLVFQILINEFNSISDFHQNWNKLEVLIYITSLFLIIYCEEEREEEEDQEDNDLIQMIILLIHTIFKLIISILPKLSSMIILHQTICNFIRIFSQKFPLNELNKQFTCYFLPIITILHKSLNSYNEMILKSSSESLKFVYQRWGNYFLCHEILILEDQYECCISWFHVIGFHIKAIISNKSKLNQLYIHIIFKSYLRMILELSPSLALKLYEHIINFMNEYLKDLLYQFQVSSNTLELSNLYDFLKEVIRASSLIKQVLIEMKESQTNTSISGIIAFIQLIENVIHSNSLQLPILSKHFLLLLTFQLYTDVLESQVYDINIKSSNIVRSIEVYLSESKENRTTVFKLLGALVENIHVYEPSDTLMTLVMSASDYLIAYAISTLLVQDNYCIYFENKSDDMDIFFEFILKLMNFNSEVICLSYRLIELIDIASSGLLISCHDNQFKNIFYVLETLVFLLNNQLTSESSRRKLSEVLLCKCDRLLPSLCDATCLSSLKGRVSDSLFTFLQFQLAFNKDCCYDVLKNYFMNACKDLIVDNQLYAVQLVEYLLRLLNQEKRLFRMFWDDFVKIKNFELEPTTIFD